MANTYNWVINSLDVLTSLNDLNNVVYKVHYEYIATSEEVDEEGNNYTGKIKGKMDIDVPDSENFIEFEDLTEDQVIGWLESKLNMDKFKFTADVRVKKPVDNLELQREVETPW